LRAGAARIKILVEQHLRPKNQNQKKFAKKFSNGLTMTQRSPYSAVSFWRLSDAGFSK
jgi:hypothetical protein